MMELVTDEPTIDAEENDIEILKTPRQGRIHYPGAVRKKAYIFDGTGNYFTKEWDLSEGSGSEFCWYHVELPRENKKLTVCAKYLIDVLCPPLKLQDILTLASNGPFCGNVNGALVFRVNSSGPALSKSTLRLAARVTENSVITVSLGRVPRLGFYQTGRSVLSDIPSVESPNYVGEDRATRSSGTVIKDHVLESFLQMNHFEECDNPVPKTISNLLVHILDTHMDNLEDIVVRLELDLDSVELELDKGQLLMDDHPTLFWTPCAAHCIDLMLHDICKLPIITRTVKRAITLNGYIYNHPYVLNMMRTFTEQKELIQPGVIRFATVFLTLQSIHNQKITLRRMFTSEEWSTSRYHRDTKGKNAYETVMSIGFWNNILYSLRATRPLVRVLCLVDSEKKPAMGYIYEAMDRAKEAIKKSFNDNEARYEEIWEIIDKRWNDQLHRPFHAAGYYLNPEYFYSTPRIESNAELNKGFLDILRRLVPDEAIQDQVETELSTYRYAQGIMGSPNAIRNRALKSPGDFSMKKQMLNERKIPKMNLDLQRLLQAVAHGEQVFPRVKEKCASKSWFASEDIASIDELTSRLRRLKENVGFIANRVTAIQAGLDSWQSEQINKKLYYLSFLSIIFLPLSIITGIFGMNVGGVPWTGQKNPAIKDGFRNVIIICIAMLLLLLFCFAFPSLYTLITTWRRRVIRRSFSLNRKSFKKRTINGSAYEGGSGYIRI